MLKIRPAEINDIEQVFKIQEELGLSHWSRKDYAKELNSPDTIFLIAEDNQQIIGFIFTRLVNSLNLCEIINFGVKISEQKKGIGESLLNKLIKKCLKLNYSRIELEVREQNLQAVKFYLKNGFVTDGIRKNFYQNPSDNAVLMSLDIKK